MAKCPRCAGELGSTTIAGVELDVCYSCRGIWFDSGELEQVLQLQQQTLAQIPFYEDPQPGEYAAWDPPPAFCPGCSAALNSRRIKESIPVITQVCPNKHGLWLDPGELRRIKQLHDSLAAGTPEDDVEAEKIGSIEEEDSKRARKSNPISLRTSFTRKGQLILMTSLFLALAFIGLLLALTQNFPEARIISRDFTAESSEANGNEIVRTFSTDTTEGTSTQGAKAPQGRKTKSNSTTKKSKDKVEEAELNAEDLRDEALADGIDAFLASRRSPMAGTGAIFVAAGNETGVNPILSVAIAGKESSYGRHCFAPHNAFGMLAPQYSKGFSSWEKAIWANCRYLLKRYGKVSSPYQCLGYCVPDHPWMEDVASIMNAILDSL